MRTVRLFVPDDLHAGQTLVLGPEATHHLVTVLRAKTGQPLLLCNNTGIEATATLLTADRKAARVQVDGVLAVNRESPLAIHLAIGISRGERMDLVLQKSTELGVTSITPLVCERTEVRLSGERLQKKTEQWLKIVTGACEQSGRTRLPHLQDPATLAECLAMDSSDLRLVLHHRTDSALSRITATPQRVLLVVGPEGGLSATEIHQAEQAGCCALALGPRVLRTETAPLAALSVLQYRWGDLGGL